MLIFIPISDTAIDHHTFVIGTCGEKLPMWKMFRKNAKKESILFCKNGTFHVDKNWAKIWSVEKNDKYEGYAIDDIRTADKPEHMWDKDDIMKEFYNKLL